MARLDDKTAFITGAAGSIGAASARLLVAEGARVVLGDLDGDRLDALVSELGPDRAAALAADVTDSDAVREAVALAVDRFGGLDVAFANAGVAGVPATIAEFPEDVFDEVMAVNVRGAFLVAKHALAVMRDGGSLIFTSSVVGLTSAPGIAAYATSKHALVGLMRTAAKEGAPRGIRANSIHPGPVDNEFQHAIEERATGESRERAAEIFEGMIPLARHAQAEEVAQLVRYLASDESAFVTGAALPIDGGMSI